MFRRVCFVVILALSAAVFGCSSGGDSAREKGGQPLSPDIDNIMGFYWDDGTDVLSDRSMYDVKTKGEVETFSYIGDPYYSEDFGVSISYERFEFADGGLVGAEFEGDDFDDMESLREYLTEEYGKPGESHDGRYKWVSATGTLVLEDVDDYWSLMGWSDDAPDYWN